MVGGTVLFNFQMDGGYYCFINFTDIVYVLLTIENIKFGELFFIIRFFYFNGE